MKNFLKVGVFALLAIIFFVTGIFVYLRISYEIVVKQMCQEPAIVEQVVQKINETNTSTEPFIVLKLKTNEVEALLNSAENETGTTFCINIRNNEQIDVFMKRNPFVWSQAELKIIEQKPFVSLSKIHWNGLAIPGYLEKNANAELLDAFNKYFESGTLTSRYFDRLEIDGDTFIIYSSVNHGR